MYYRIPKDTEMNLELLAYLMHEHKKMIVEKYDILKKAYMSDHDILHAKAKPKWKPDNRIVANFAKYIVDTMNGFFLGNPIKTTSDDDTVSSYVETLDQYNGQDDKNSELSKICSIYGKSYEMYYLDEYLNLCTAFLDPTEAFMVFDDSILERPMFFIRFYTDWKGNEFGSISDKTHIRHFATSGGYRWTDEWEPHYFDGVPATEYIENEERQSIFEPVLSMINAYDKALSEKANDVDYFADAYMKILGTKINDKDLEFIRDNRVVNLDGDISDKDIIVEFMGKPSSDESQEHFLERLERLIFNLSMVANISDENFGASSGIALKYKLQSMSNLEKVKERKFSAGMNRRYKILFSHPRSKVSPDSWVGLKYHFTPNFPANLLDEAEVSTKLEGVVSKQTQLKVLSIVDDVNGEIDRMDKESEEKKDDLDARILGFGEHQHEEA